MLTLARRAQLFVRGKIQKLKCKLGICKVKFVGRTNDYPVYQCSYCLRREVTIHDVFN